MLGAAALWGAAGALSWGFADFTARFAGRAVGVIPATFGMTTIGAVLIFLYMLIAGEPFIWQWHGIWWMAGTGVLTVLATLTLYEALTKGPVSLGSPVVASYPAIAVPVTMALGTLPSWWQLMAMIATMAGVWLVAWAVARTRGDERPEYAKPVVRRALAMAIISALCFAFALLSADKSVEIYGPWETVLAVRIIGVVMLAFFVMGGRGRMVFTRKALPLIVALAFMDSFGHAAVYIGLGQPHGEFAIVTSSAYTVVTVIMARVFLREAVSLAQWGGVLLVVGGIVGLTLLP